MGGIKDFDDEEFYGFCTDFEPKEEIQEEMLTEIEK